MIRQFKIATDKPNVLVVVTIAERNGATAWTIERWTSPEGEILEADITADSQIMGPVG